MPRRPDFLRLVGKQSTWADAWTSTEMSKPLSCLLSVRVDFNFSDPCYVLQLASSYKPDQTECVLAAALSNNQIKILSHNAVDLQSVCSLQGHSDRVTDISVPNATSPWLVLSASEDKTIKLWDTRCSKVAEECAYAMTCLRTGPGSQSHTTCPTCANAVLDLLTSAMLQIHMHIWRVILMFGP